MAARGFKHVIDERPKRFGLIVGIARAVPEEPNNFVDDAFAIDVDPDRLPSDGDANRQRHYFSEVGGL